MSKLDFKRATITFDSDTEYVNRNYETASWWTKHVIPAGAYELALVNIGYTPWIEGSVTPGFIGDVGPYYATVSIPGRTVEKYFVNRLFTASSVRHDQDVDEPCTVHLTMYAYEVKDGLERWGGTVRTYQEASCS